MDISNIVNAPITLATNCWQRACQNKKAIAVVALGTAAIAAAACLLDKRNELLSMYDKIFEVAKNPSEKNYSKYIERPGPVIGLDTATCPSSFKRYEIKIQFPVGEIPSAEQLDRIEALYNEATSNGTDVFSRFGYFAGKYYRGEAAPKIPNTEFYRFVICRENLSTRFFSGIEKMSLSSLDALEASVLGTREFLHRLTQQSIG